MDIAGPVKRAIDETRRLRDAGSPPGDFFWQGVFDQLEKVKRAGDDFETSQSLFRGVGRMLVDDPDILKEWPPALLELSNVMQNWRRARKRGWE